MQETDASAARFLEQSRHQAAEHQGAEQPLGAAGMGQEKIAAVAAAIVESGERSNGERPLPPTAAIAVGRKKPRAEPESSESSEPQP